MSDHICPDCGIDRTAIIGMYCDACHEWVDELDMDYEEFQAMHEEEHESQYSDEEIRGIIGECNEKARNDEDGYTTH